MALRRLQAPNPADAKAAFGLLEAALKKTFPGLPEGFTWREGMAEARRKRLDLNWEELDRELNDYEAYRYGSGLAPAASQPELLKLLKSLRGSW